MINKSRLYGWVSIFGGIFYKRIRPFFSRKSYWNSSLLKNLICIKRNEFQLPLVSFYESYRIWCTKENYVAVFQFSNGICVNYADWFLFPQNQTEFRVLSRTFYVRSGMNSNGHRLAVEERLKFTIQKLFSIWVSIFERNFIWIQQTGFHLP